MLYDTKLLLERALPLERAGHWDAAIALCEEVFSRSVRDADPSGTCEAVLRMGLCYRQTGDSENAAEHLNLALTIAELLEDDGRAGRALNGLAALHHSHGDLAEAESYYLRAQKLAESVKDLLTCGNIHQNLGALAAVRGDREEAIRHYHVALDYYASISHDRGIAGVHNNLGITYVLLKEYDRAALHLSEALATARQIGDVLAEGLIRVNEAEMHIGTGALDEARVSCDEAYEIASKTGEYATRIDVLRLYGMIYRESGRLYLAETHLGEAIQLSHEKTLRLEEAQAQRELALVLRAQGKNREALGALNRALELFQYLQAKDALTDVGDRIAKLEDDFLSLVRAWGESIEAKDRYTSGHCQRVANYACRIAVEAGFPQMELVWFRMGAFLHDVGKTEVPEEILNKPGALTLEERVVMERHTVAGDEMLATVAFPWDIRSMVRWHHERWDGGGYPDGLQGTDIPLTARILRLADVFDALTTSRSYRAPLTADEAVKLMIEDRGSFDPVLFEIFLGLLDEFRASATAAQSRDS
jgi:putative nucleotidyltransferase with HDIG domain